MSDIAEAMKEAFEGIVGDIRNKLREAQGDQGLIEDLKQFAAAVDWSEPWIIGLLGSEAILLIAVLVFRKSTWFQTLAFFICAAAVRMAETINTYLGSRWTEFATQPYFDSRGVFISALMSAPLMLIMFVVLINYLLSSVSLLVDMKSKELKLKARQRARQERTKEE